MVLLKLHLQVGVHVHGWGGGAPEPYWLREAENSTMTLLIFSSSDIG